MAPARAIVSRLFSGFVGPAAVFLCLALIVALASEASGAPRPHTWAEEAAQDNAEKRIELRAGAEMLISRRLVRLPAALRAPCSSSSISVEWQRPIGAYHERLRMRSDPDAPPDH